MLGPCATAGGPCSPHCRRLCEMCGKTCWVPLTMMMHSCTQLVLVFFPAMHFAQQQLVQSFSRQSAWGACRSDRGHPAAQRSPGSSHSSAPVLSTQPSTGSALPSSRAPSAASLRPGTAALALAQHAQPGDYLQARREAKELAEKERQIDAALRAVRTAELVQRPKPEQLQALLADCRRCAQFVAIWLANRRHTHCAVAG